MAKLKGKHSSQPFNPAIADVFFRAGEIEAWGRGIERILVACREAGVAEPEIEYEATGLWMKFTFPQEIVAITEGGPRPGEEKTREKLLRVLQDNPYAAADESAAAMGITRKGVEWQIRRLKQEGLLKRIGPDKGGRWEVVE